ncbi:hypothetical protein TrVE_jg7966 [Triparma verrucosa]|uniref:Ion transport domain-containing protein n=1 Tax=Triparma verrucosa TaxID=1606542 RepID=A0A9W6Z605_9STRA|nr:hypothetical protein TrVE_jg7966 [Triparma verrucosa]
MEILSGGSKGGTTDKNILLHKLNALGKNSETKVDKDDDKEGIRCLSVSKVVDSNTWWMVTGGTNSSLNIWNYTMKWSKEKGAEEGSWKRQKQKRPVHRGMVSAVAVSNDGETFVSGDRQGGSVIVWRENSILTKIDAGDEVYSLALSRKKTYIAIGTKCVFLYKTHLNSEAGEEVDHFVGDVKTEELEKCEGSENLAGHDDAEWVTCLRFTKDESKLVSSSRDHKVIVWNTSTREPLQNFHHPDVVMGVDFTNVENLILSTCDDQTARLWDISSHYKQEKNPTALHEYPERHGGMVSDKNIVVSRFGNEVISWRLGYKSEKDQKYTSSRDGDIIFRYHHDSDAAQIVRAAVFTPDGNTIISATDTDNEIHFNHNVSSLNHHLPSATHNMLLANFNQSEDLPGKFEWKQSDIGRLVEKNSDCLVEPRMIDPEDDDEEGLRGQNMAHFAAANDISGYLDTFLSYEHFSNDKATNEKLQRTAMASVLMLDSQGQCPLECALENKNGSSVNAILQCYKKILSPDLVSFPESSRAQEAHLSELIDVKLLIKSLDEFPFITLNFLKTLELAPCYKIVRDGCDRAPIPDDQQDVRGSEERSPYRFWQEKYFPEQKKANDASIVRKKRELVRKSRSSLSNISKTNIHKSGTSLAKCLTKITDVTENSEASMSSANPINVQSDGDPTKDTEPLATNKQKAGTPLVPVIAKVVPLKNCATPEFLTALKLASEKTKDYRVWENEVIMSIVQFKWAHGFSAQYKRHFWREIVMVLTFTIDTVFISLVNEHDDYLPGYFKYGGNKDKLMFWLWRTPIAICFYMWVYFMKHEIKLHVASYRKVLRKHRKVFGVSTDSCCRWFGFEKSGQLVRIIIGTINGVKVFILIMLLIMWGFSMAFYVFYRTLRAGDKASVKDIFNYYENPGSALLYYYGIMLGEIPDVNDYILDDPVLSCIGVIGFVVFTLLINIVMLNLLIAIMGDIFDKVQDNAKAEFIFGKATIICEYEETRAMKFRDWLMKQGRMKKLPDKILNHWIVHRFLGLESSEKAERQFKETCPTWLQVLQPAVVDIEEDRNQEWGGRIKVIKQGQENLTKDVSLTKRELKEAVNAQSRLLRQEQERNCLLEEKMTTLERQNEQILNLLDPGRAARKSELESVSVSKRRAAFENDEK